MPESLEFLLGQKLKENGLSLAVAESSTGGLLGHLVTSVPGSSTYFRGGVIAYANEVKIGVLGVSLDTIETFGAVSRETVLEMASGVRRVLQTDIGIAISGIAGPDGGTEEKPVGTTWIGLSAPGMEAGKTFVFPGDRHAIKRQAAHAALNLLLNYFKIIRKL